MARPDRTSLGAFLQAVGKHWLTLMSGGFITVALGLYERWSQTNVPIWAYAVIVVAFMLSACYLAWRDAVTALGQRKNIPELKIVFSGEEPFVHYSSYNDTTEGPLVCSTIRIGVTHDSFKTVNNIQARVERLDFEKDAPLFSVPLRLMHDRFPYKHEFTVDPGETQYVDVATMGIIHGRVIHICHVIADEKMSFIEVKPHDLRITVTGQDALSDRVTLRIEPTDKGLLTAKVSAP